MAKNAKKRKKYQRYSKSKMSKNSILKLKVAKKFDFEVEIAENQKKSIDFAIFFSKFSKRKKRKVVKKTMSKTSQVPFSPFLKNCEYTHYS